MLNAGDALGRGSDAAERASAALLEMISSGAIAPGARLRETALADELGMSRTPVREALRRLAAEGLVEISPNKGARLMSFTEEDLLELYSVRARMEPLAVRLAIPRLNGTDLQQLSTIVSEMEELASGTMDVDKMTVLNNRFHSLFVERCGNTVLASALAAVIRPAVVNRTFKRYDDAAMRRSMAHHRDILFSAISREAEWGEAAMAAHIFAGRHAYSPTRSGPRHV